MSENFSQGIWIKYSEEDGKSVISLSTYDREEDCGFLEGVIGDKVIASCNTKADTRLIKAAPSMYYLLRFMSTLGEHEILDDKFRE